MQKRDFTNVFSKDISEKMRFSRCGYDYQCIYYNQDFHCGVWRMTRKEDGRFSGYEVVRGKHRLNPDGTVVYNYPSDEDFGVYGFYGYHLDRLLVHLDEWMELE